MRGRPWVCLACGNHGERQRPKEAYVEEKRGESWERRGENEEKRGNERHAVLCAVRCVLCAVRCVLCDVWYCMLIQV